MKSILEVGNLKANGHYAFATIHQNTVYVSGQFAINPETREKEFGPIEEETLQALKNVEMIVEAAGSKKEKILRMTLYISDIELWDKVDAVYTEFFGEHQPARTVVPTNELHFRIFFCL
ncbi:RidA family protein [Bacillus safensis]|uniref:RidA family protein n=1 Tax=Bacillus safensis TaxID=561879 RepID=UPI001FF75CCD|nr:RidA family protein [Bacillus safensis]MCK1972073.1 RidA family protein [Bacillus safensis]